MQPETALGASGKDFAAIVSDVGSHCRGMKWFCLSYMIALASVRSRHGLKQQAD